MKLYIIISIILSNIAFADLRGLPQITVLSSSSLTLPMTEISRTYSRKHNISVTNSYLSSENLSKRIEEGSPADIIISSHPFWIKNLKQKGLIDVYSISNLLKNRLAIIAPKDFPKEYKDEDSLEILKDISSKIFVIGSDQSSIGNYTFELFNNLNIEESNVKNAIKSGSSKDILYLTSKGKNPSIVFLSEAYNNEEVKVLHVFDEDLHSPIIYQAAVVAGENMSHAREYLEFLNSKESQEIFKRYGLNK